MGTAKLTKKNQASIPKEIREFLSVGPGDSVQYEIEDDRVILSKHEMLDRKWHEALGDTLEEWSSDEDERAFEHLQKV